MSILIGVCILVACAEPNSAPRRPASSTATPKPTPSSAATLMVIESPTWTLYQEPHHYFSLEYPSAWQVDPGEPPLSNSPVWDFSGLLVTRPVTQVIEIGRDAIPIHPSQTMEAWEASKGPGELAKAIVEQKKFQMNGREVYFVKTSVLPQGAAYTTYFRCGTWVWFVWSKVGETADAAEFDVIYDHVVNTFTPKCN